MTCHGPNLAGSNYGTPLSGPYFAGNWAGKPVGALYTKAHDTMPPSRPGGLPEASYVDIVAYILQTNGVPAGDTELPAGIAELNAMTIPAAP